MKTIGACLIVKNEAPVIERCLRSILPIIDYVYISDTGSTDGTQNIIKQFLIDNNVSGEVVEESWVNFAFNRTKALEGLRANKDIDYVLIIDADEVLEIDQSFNVESFKSTLDKDLYNVITKNGNISYQRPQLFRNNLDFYYKGVLHEFIESPANITRGDVVGFINKPSYDGHRSQNINKFQDDAKVLEDILKTETDPFMVSRYTFYLAQSYRDCGNKQLARKIYVRRSKLGFWQEEIYISLLNAARLAKELGFVSAEVINAYMLAHESLPSRKEALHDLIKYCRLHKYYDTGYRLAANCSFNDAPAGLFIEDWIYDYGLLFEFSIICYWAGHHKEAMTACDILLYKNIPDHIREQVIKNRKFSEDKVDVYF